MNYAFGVHCSVIFLVQYDLTRLLGLSFLPPLVLSVPVLLGLSLLPPLVLSVSGLLGGILGDTVQQVRHVGIDTHHCLIS